MLEYEGDQHRTDPHQWNRDIERHERLLAAGEKVVRITAQRMARPRAVVSLVVQSLRAAGDGGPDPLLTPEWLAVFSPSARRSRLAHAFEVPGRALGG
ncbi:MAG: hypothetical protein AVDCRST_MAG61-4 [uncultured Friedmanniella sp.]|uniref:DUF559 domain-containing protein n=1 Tax=uncultured Friedmanniella sp. TaxID=335381 RepID=A0A6J4JW51_9ACTN|nr:MAG: hypothetical protein AVDCRST_MAG61-4 [uncultured Friedmanniella sp.]